MTRDEFRQILVEEFSDAFAYSYFDRSEFTPGPTPVLYPWSLVAEDRFRNEARRCLQREGVKLGPPVLDHLKPKTRRAA